MSIQAFNPSSLPQSDTNWAVARRLAAAFAPRAASPENMTVVVEAGSLLRDGALIDTGVQVTPTFTRPTALRVDRVVISRSTGLVSVVAGTEGSMTPPALPADALPCARVFLRADTPLILNEDIIDERSMIDTTPAASAQIACHAALPNQSLAIPSGSRGLIIFTATQYNLGGAYDTTNGRFKPSLAGYYSVNFSVGFTMSVVNTFVVGIRKTTATGTELYETDVFPAGPGTVSANVSDVIRLNGTDEYLECVALQSTGSALVPLNYATSFMSAIRVG